MVGVVIKYTLANIKVNKINRAITVAFFFVLLRFTLFYSPTFNQLYYVEKYKIYSKQKKMIVVTIIFFLVVRIKGDSPNRGNVLKANLTGKQDKRVAVPR
jgi:hypothetical protein